MGLGLVVLSKPYLSLMSFAHTHTHTHTHAHEHSHTLAHTRTHLHTLTHTVLSQTHTRTHILYSYTHTYTHNLQEDERWSLVTAEEEGASVMIAAIDNGLAFPFKHPDQWRTCELVLHLQY